MDPVKDQIRGLLQSRSKARVEREGFRRAAVLMPLCAVGGQPHFVFTERARDLEHHQGQISFPGGTADQRDPHLLQTALREAEEEIGLKPADVEVLGELDDVLTAASGFIISPFVAWIPHPYPFRPSAREVHEIFTVPLSEFQDPRNYREEFRERAGERIAVPFFTCGSRVIWGATGRIVKQFLDLLAATPAR